ncbi:hypothetical protein B0A49_11457 [Cryomyces minteri]|uniref:Non-haem dioxygenase N-terminal domain-containing protein n=1 Tax=Cryomyces minteri TaxID=331657 RepID=A0A4U0W0G2_9PEZI|nr:hypothetical protein B0A49_11457 [Cryomyces minteri]
MPSRLSIPPFPDHVPTADITTVDFDFLSRGDQAEARKGQDVARGNGFFYVKNHPVNSDFMFDLANKVFQLPLDEKLKHDMGTKGRHSGCKRSGSQYADEKGTPDQSEFYNVSRDDILRIGDAEPLKHPQPAKARRAELERFTESSHHAVTVVTRALSEQLGLGPDALPSLHRIDRTGGDQARVTQAPPASARTITLGALSTAEPPTRVHSCVYFSRPTGHVPLRSLFAGPLLDGEEKAPTADEWVVKRAVLRSTADDKGTETFHRSRGTEHTRDRGRAALNAPRNEVEAV